MSDSDSFIEEVTEEVRRDRLFALIRRYGWIAVACVILLVGAASWNEWSKARDAAAAQAFGDALTSALSQSTTETRRAALNAIEVTPEQAPLVAMFLAEIEIDPESGEADAAQAAKSLQAVADNGALPQVYRELAVLKYTMLPDTGLSPEDRIARLEPLTVPGGPYRLLALEQTALARVDLGETDVALGILTDVLSEDRVSESLRRRVSQLIVALGGTLDTA